MFLQKSVIKHLTMKYFIPLVLFVLLCMKIISFANQGQIKKEYKRMVGWDGYLSTLFREKIITLNGVWELSNRTKGSVTADVPGGVHTALIKAGLLGDPYYRKNDAEYLWVGRANWTYARKFTVPVDILSKDQIMLVCEGLDTVSSIYINNNLVGNSDNMFVRYMFDIKSVLQLGENEIIVTFESAVTYAERKAKEAGYPIPPECPPDYFRGECHGNMVRKMQCAFSWDWGPAFVTSGIWKDIYIRAFNTLVITDVTTETHSDGKGGWRLRVRVFIVPPKAGTLRAVFRVVIGGTDIAAAKEVTLSSASSNVFIDVFIQKKSSVRAWWPRGYGSQTLYNVTATLDDVIGNVLAQKSVRVGFKTFELVQDPIEGFKEGLTFYFRVNGRAIFLKGSNWIPADSFPERVTNERLRNYLQSAVDANMNCLRVWGGGIYESDYFYELADEMGILIWQDFMFACALYPADEHFLTSVREEITQQARRLQNHPSVMAYSGNNENEMGLKGGWYFIYHLLKPRSGLQPLNKGFGWGVRDPKYAAEYVKLYINTVQSIVRQEDPTRPIMLSSPSNGVLTEMEGGLSRHPGDTRYGDIHDYQYSLPFYKVSTYKTPRMASEYGLQSFPSMDSLRPVYDIADMVYDSDLNEYRQHHARGNDEMKNLISMYMMPPSAKDPIQEFEDLIYCSQIVQAVGMRTETEHYRRWQNDVNSFGEGKTMGALYWMFADIWPAPSWASLEYGGKWKMLHYFARHFFAPILISPYIDGDKLKVYIVVDEDENEVADFRNPLEADEDELDVMSRFPVNLSQSWVDADNVLNEHRNDYTYTLLSGMLYVRVYFWESLQPKYTEEIPVQTGKPAELVYEAALSDLVNRSGCGAVENCVVFMHLGDAEEGPSSWLPLTTFREAKGLRIADIKISVVGDAIQNGECTVLLTTDNISPYVWLNVRGIKGRFSDNGFLMIEEKKTVTFYTWEDTSCSKVAENLTVQSLMDIYNR